MAAFTLALTAGCSSLQPVPLEFIAASKPPVVHVSDGYRVVVMANPRVSGDTVLGTEYGAQVAIPLREVQKITTTRFNGGRTAVLVGGLAAMGALATYAVLANSNGRSDFACDWSEPKRDGVRCGFGT